MSYWEKSWNEVNFIKTFFFYSYHEIHIVADYTFKPNEGMKNKTCFSHFMYCPTLGERLSDWQMWNLTFARWKTEHFKCLCLACWKWLDNWVCWCWLICQWMTSGCKLNRFSILENWPKYARFFLLLQPLSCEKGPHYKLVPNTL